jgi:hypothetical protein
MFRALYRLIKFVDGICTSGQVMPFYSESDSVDAMRYVAHLLLSKLTITRYFSQNVNDPSYPVLSDAHEMRIQLGWFSS